MNITIVFHSVCGNDYQIAKAFNDSFFVLGHAVLLRRVADQSWVMKPDVPKEASSILTQMRSTSEASPEDLLSADLILMGAPTYFGNVSAQMKAFMDQTGGLWFKGLLAGKKFAAFTSAGNTEGGGDLCLQALHTYGKYMGMLSMPVPVSILKGENVNVLGVIHHSNGKYAAVLEDKNQRLIKLLAAFFVK